MRDEVPGGALPLPLRPPLTPSPLSHARPSRAGVALTLGLHALLVWLSWLAAVPRQAAHAPQLAQERASTLVLVVPLPLSREADSRSARTPAAAHAPQRTRRPVPAARGKAEADGVMPAVSVAATGPTTAPDAAPDAALDNASAATVEAAPETRAPGELLASSKRMAGAVDRALRRGASPITAEPERKWERFAQAVAEAHTGNREAVTLSSYTAPDGVVVYRKTVGARVLCYRSGSVGGLVGGFGPADGRGAGTIPCPSGADWRRH